jgi:hypothetical protein
MKFVGHALLSRDIVLKTIIEYNSFKVLYQASLRVVNPTFSPRKLKVGSIGGSRVVNPTFNTFCSF